MDFIPLIPNDDLNSILDSMADFPFRFVAVSHPGEYDKEKIVFTINKDIDTLSDYILFYMVEDTSTGLPDYSKCRLLTFDDIELQEGSILQIYTGKGEDTTTIDHETNSFCNIMYWGLEKPIWDTPHASYEIITRTESFSGSVTDNQQ